jgi:uncharacterized Zn finger protein
MAQKRPTTDGFAALTWNDLQEWAGSSTVSRGRSYQRNHQVQSLVRTPSGSLLAWVQGTHRYAIQVEITEGDLSAPAPWVFHVSTRWQRCSTIWNTSSTRSTFPP